MFQHPTTDNEGEKREPLQVGDKRTKTVLELPDSYTNIRPAFFRKKNPSPPRAEGLIVLGIALLKPQLALKYEWLEKVCVIEEVDGALNVTWSVHHASKKRSALFEVSITALLPLLRDQAHSVATIKHVMGKISDTVAFLNPGQVPFIDADQPIYAVAKQIQWY